MKKKLTFLFLSIFLVLTFSTCKDDVDVKYSKNTIEENKQNIEEEGLETIDKLNGMKDLGSIFAVQDLSILLQETGSVGMVAGFNPVIDFLKPIANMDKNPMGLVALRATNEAMDDFYYFFGKEAGIYTWNNSLQQFDWTTSPDELTFRYPTNGSSTNNATLRFDNLSTITTTNDSFPGEKFPESLDVTLVSSGSTLFNLEFRGEYNNDDLPSKVSATLEFNEGYKFTTKFSNSTSKASWDVSYSFDGDDIFAAHFESKGDFGFDNITGNEDLSTQDQVDNFLNSANAWVQVGNLKLAGLVDYDGFYNASNSEFPDNKQYYTLEENTRKAELYNKYIKLCLLYAKEKQAIAKSAFYAYEYDPEYYPGEYTTNLKFVFEDGTSMDESFFESGFEELLTAYEDFMSEMSNILRGDQPI